MQIVSRPTARLTGTVTIGGRAWTLSAEPGMVSHYWGSRLPKRWTWVSVIGSESEPRLESTVLRSRLWGTPLTLTVGYLWRYGEPPTRSPVLTVMPAVRRSASQGCPSRQRGSRHESAAALALAPQSLPDVHRSGRPEEVVTLHVSTHRLGGTGGRIALSRLIASLDEIGAQGIEVSNLPLDIEHSRRKQLVHVMAGCLAGVADVDHLANLGEGQAGDPAAADEVQP